MFCCMFCCMFCFVICFCGVKPIPIGFLDGIVGVCFGVVVFEGLLVGRDMLFRFVALILFKLFVCVCVSLSLSGVFVVFLFLFL